MIARLSGLLDDFGPDWAVIDRNQPKTTRAPGGIADAGFFNEAWQWQK